VLDVDHETFAEPPQTEPKQRRHGQRGQVIGRGKNVWLLRVPLGRNESGKRKYLNETFHGSKKKAQERLTALLGKKDGGVVLAPPRMTFDAYLNQWLEMMKTQVGPHTHADYTNLMRRYVRPLLGGRQLAKITVLDLDQLYANMVGRGLSVRTVRAVHVAVKRALKDAVRKHLISHNPAVDADPPKRTSNEQQREKPVFRLEEAAAFVRATNGQRLGPMFLLQLVTGMRPGECRGLQWQDVDLERGMVTVRQAMSHYGVKDGETWSFGPTKTKRVNTIPIPKRVVQALRHHRAIQEEEKRDAGPEYRDYGLVFCTRLGTPLNHDNVAKRDFKQVLKVAGLPGSSTLYSLRHSCATLLLSEGVHPKVVSERLGHASITTTLQTYAHVLPTMQEKALEVLNRLLLPDKSAKVSG
jgi:integrase